VAAKHSARSGHEGDGDRRKHCADCLTAIQKLVFDDKKITMSEPLDALADNFEGLEE